MDKNIAKRLEFSTDVKKSDGIVSPVQLEPEVDYAVLSDPVTGWSVSLGVRGEVKFDNGYDCYHSWAEFPKPLKKAVRDGNREVIDGYTSEGGMPWFEAFVWDDRDEYVDSIVCDDDIFAHGNKNVKKELSSILLETMERFGKATA